MGVSGPEGYLQARPEMVNKVLSVSMKTISQVYTILIDCTQNLLLTFLICFF